MRSMMWISLVYSYKHVSTYCSGNICDKKCIVTLFHIQCRNTIFLFWLFSYSIPQSQLMKLLFVCVATKWSQQPLKDTLIIPEIDSLVHHVSRINYLLKSCLWVCIFYVHNIQTLWRIGEGCETHTRQEVLKQPDFYTSFI